MEGTASRSPIQQRLTIEAPLRGVPPAVRSVAANYKCKTKKYEKSALWEEKRDRRTSNEEEIGGKHDDDTRALIYWYLGRCECISNIRSLSRREEAEEAEARQPSSARMLTSRRMTLWPTL
eukprot:9502501-Pyramimonas_sp.AAC.2